MKYIFFVSKPELIVCSIVDLEKMDLLQVEKPNITNYLVYPKTKLLLKKNNFLTKKNKK
jgi:hypothetical protein